MFNTNFRSPRLFGNNWKSLETRKRFFKSVFQPWSTTPTECQRLVSFSWTRTRTILRIARLLVSRRDATQPLASPGCLAPLCQPKMEKCGKTCATPRFSCTLSRMGCWCLVLTLALSPGCSPTLSLRKSRLDNVTSPFCLRHQEALVIRTGNAIIKQMFM